MARHTDFVLYPKALQPGDRVCLISPASTPNEDGVDRFVELLEEWGLRPEIAPHVFDRYGFVAGTDEARLADLDAAIRDKGIRAIFATRGGAGAYHLIEGIDFEAMARDPKPLVGFSDISVLHAALWRHCRVPGIHGGMFAYFPRKPEPASAEMLRRALMTTEPVSLQTHHDEPTSRLTTSGRAEGILIGGNQDSLATVAGWALPSLKILFLEDIGKSLGGLDRQLTMLAKAGHLEGLRGVAIGQYIDCGPKDAPGVWTVVDVLRNHLSRWKIPILGGLAVGHDNDAYSLPIGTWARLDANAGTLTVDAAVR